MICDKLENWTQLTPQPPELYVEGFKWIEEHLHEDLELGRHEISGEMYAMVNSGPTKPLSEGKFENHHKYADIQYFVEGRERIFWTKPKEYPEVESYSEEKDIEFFAADDPIGDASYLLMEPGMFAIFLPSDWHMPSINPCDAAGVECEAANVVKIVVKVPQT